MSRKVSDTGKPDIDALSASVEMSKEQFLQLLKEFDNLEDFLAYVQGLDNVHEDFELQMKAIQAQMQSFQCQHPQQLTMMALFHIEGNPYSKQKGKGEVMHCITNILNNTDDEPSKAHIIEILFNNCKLSHAFQDIIEGAYHCLQKANMIGGKHK